MATPPGKHNIYSATRPRRTICPESLSASEIEQFWAEVERSEANACWIWRGEVAGKPTHRYGRFWIARDGVREPWYAHRIAFELTCRTLRDGEVVCHRCDTPRCCNPSHLFAGTPGDNVRDASQKGHLRVSRPRRQKISTEDLVAVDRLLERGIAQKSIAQQFGVSTTWVSLYVRGLRRQYDRPGAR